ncbi:hypothetical protein PAPYR_4341 [Paratrimastix pyriformis]|uniref:C2H2-type domain-containing protein n=1 Tax=Paratrimastix pyriformis TaxID=342808 RepID=A0ABQ8UK56_9EUKA|nr:hypothetical protein PAPYR_4341 [Paratrimastix pyriformis]
MTRKWCCSFCSNNQAFQRESALFRHLKMNHPKEPTYRCTRRDICSATFGTLEKMIAHVSDSHVPRYTCPVEGCDSQFDHPVGVSLHIAQKHPGMSFLPCPRCKERFVTQAQLKAHLQNHPNATEEPRGRTRRRRTTDQAPRSRHRDADGDGDGDGDGEEGDGEEGDGDEDEDGAGEKEEGEEEGGEGGEDEEAGQSSSGPSRSSSAETATRQASASRERTRPSRRPPKRARVAPEALEEDDGEPDEAGAAEGGRDGPGTDGDDGSSDSSGSAIPAQYRALQCGQFRGHPLLEPLSGEDKAKLSVPVRPDALGCSFRHTLMAVLPSPCGCGPLGTGQAIWKGILVRKKWSLEVRRARLEATIQRLHPELPKKRPRSLALLLPDFSPLPADSPMPDSAGPAPGGEAGAAAGAASAAEAERAYVQARPADAAEEAALFESQLALVMGHYEALLKTAAPPQVGRLRQERRNATRRMSRLNQRRLNAFRASGEPAPAATPPPAAPAAAEPPSPSAETSQPAPAGPSPLRGSPSAFVARLMGQCSYPDPYYPAAEGTPTAAPGAPAPSGAAQARPASPPVTATPGGAAARTAESPPGRRVVADDEDEETTDRTGDDAPGPATSSPDQQLRGQRGRPRGASGHGRRATRSSAETGDLVELPPVRRPRKEGGAAPRRSAPSNDWLMGLLGACGHFREYVLAEERP